MGLQVNLTTAIEADSFLRFGKNTTGTGTGWEDFLIDWRLIAWS